MLYLIGPENRFKFKNQLCSMHRLRKRIFIDQLKWSHQNIKVDNEMEFDQFDSNDARYLVRIMSNGEVDACTRLLPTSGPYLLGDIYPDLVSLIKRPSSDLVWETSRFCADTATAPKSIVGILVAGMLEYALDQGIKNYVSISDIRIEMILRRFGWNPERLGGTVDTGTDIAVGEKFEVSYPIYRTVCLKSGVRGPVIENMDDFSKSVKIAA